MAFERDTGVRAAVDALSSALDERALDGVERVLVFGSAGRDEAGPDSDVDVLAVLAADADERAVETDLRAIAYDVQLDHGVVVSVHAVTESVLDRRRDHPFFRAALSDGRRVDA